MKASIGAVRAGYFTPQVSPHKETVYLTRAMKIGGVSIGGGAPVTVQSMTNTDTRDALGDPKADPRAG